MGTEIKKMSIYEALAHVNSGLCAIGKNQKNQQQGFKYRGIDDIYNAVNPLFKEFGVICMPEVLNTERYETENHKGTKLAYTLHKMKYTFYAMDGSNVSCIVQGEGMDSGDKSSNKAMAIAHKYALCQMFCIPTEDMPDPDSSSPQLGKATTPAPKQEPKPQQEKPVEEKLFDPKRLDGLQKWATERAMVIDVKDGVVTVSGKTYDNSKWLKGEGFTYDRNTNMYFIRLKPVAA